MNTGQRNKWTNMNYIEESPSKVFARTCSIDGRPKRRGRIDLIIGPMFCGKSTELLRRVRRYQYAGKRCLVLKYAKDKRYSDDTVMTHDKSNSLPAQNVVRLSDVEITPDSQYDVVGIDEGQFFDDLEEFAERVANMGVVVVIAALDGDFQRKPFGKICQLIPMAESVTKLTAVCASCKNHSASFTQRTISDTRVELIGGAEMYRPVCRTCFFEETAHKRKVHKTLSFKSPLREKTANQIAKTSAPQTVKQVRAVGMEKGGL